MIMKTEDRHLSLLINSLGFFCFSLPLSLSQNKKRGNLLHCGADHPSKRRSREDASEDIINLRALGVVRGREAMMTTTMVKMCHRPLGKLN